MGPVPTAGSIGKVALDPLAGRLSVTAAAGTWTFGVGKYRDLDDLAGHCPHLSKATIDICGKNALVGTGIFDVCIEVRAYITRMLLATEGRVREQFSKRRDSVRYRVA